MRHGEVRQPLHQPAVGEDVAERHRQNRVVVALQRPRRIEQRQEALRQLRPDIAELRRWLQASARSLEQGHAEPRLGPPDVLAHRPDGDAQLFRRRLQRPGPRHNLDGVQRVER